jgi:hypothetical protein
MAGHWVKVDTGYLAHPKLLGLHPSAKLLHLASILWTAEHLTDGYVPPKALRELSESVPIAVRWRGHHASALVDAGLWDVVEPPTLGWVVHDFTEHNAAATRAAVERNRELTRDRVARHRAQQRGLWVVRNDVTDDL